MATFYNQATMTYRGNTTASNITTGELIEVLSVTKTAVNASYEPGDTITYLINIRNTGSVPITGLTFTDNLGAYSFNELTLYTLSYVVDSIRYFQNGTLQTAPTVVAGPPMRITDLTVPANGNTLLVYDAAVTPYASPVSDGIITNEVTISGNGLTPITARADVPASDGAILSISKSVSPSVVTENGQLTYTFLIQNTGNTAATVNDDIIVTDTFLPVLKNITVTWGGTAWTEGTQYTYNTETGLWQSAAGQITVPAATYEQNSETGVWGVTPGAATLVIAGTV